MSKLTEKFNFASREPVRGSTGIWQSFTPQEVATAEAAGSGAGVPDDNGTVQAGTLVAGHVLSMNSSGNVDLMSSADLTAGLPVLPWIVFEGDNDFSGAFTGTVLCFHGGCGFVTEKYSGSSFTKGVALLASSGLLAVKAYNDHLQGIAFVGERGLVAPLLHVYMPEGIWGY